jgi:cytochrome c
MGPDLTMVAQAHEASPEYETGMALIEKSDCKSCHAMQDKSVGPSFTAIASRYPREKNTIHKLATKVIAGGSGAWGEYMMSAHPHLSEQEASEMVSYILSVNENKGNTSAVAATGSISPDKQRKKEAAGEYILSVSYQDKERMGVGSNLVKQDFHFRYPRLKAIHSTDDKGVAKVSEAVVRFTESGSWIMFKDIDLTGISSLQYQVDPTQIGGQLSLHLDSARGKEIARVNIEQVKRPQKMGADQNNHLWQEVNSKILPEKGIHDLYIVYHDPKNAESSMFNTLFLDWIKFSK